MMKYLPAISLLFVFTFAADLSVEASKAITLYQEGKYFEAKPLLEKAVKDGEDEPAVVKALYNIYFRGENYAKALETFNLRKKDLLADAKSAQDYAILLMETGDLPGAEAAAVKGNQDSRSFDIRLEILLRQKNYTKLKDLLNAEKNKIAPKSWGYYSGLCLDVFGAEAQKSIAASEKDKAIRSLNDYLSLDKDPLYQFNLANLYFSGGETQNALDILAEINRERVTDADLSFKIRKLEGMSLAKNGVWDKAITALELALRVKAADFDLMYYQALCWSKVQRMDDALDAARRAQRIAKTPEQIKSINHLLSTFYIDKKNYIEAEKCLAELVRLEPQDKARQLLWQKVKSYVVFDQGNDAFDKKDFTAAVKFFDDAVALYPPPLRSVMPIMQAKSLLALALSGKSTDKTGQLEKAEKIAKVYLDDNSVIMDAHEILNAVYTERQEFEKAKEIIERQKTKIGVADSKLLSDLAYNYELQRQFGQALDYYQKSYDMKKTPAGMEKVLLMLLNLSLESMDAGAFSNTENYLAQAAKLKPDAAGIDELRLRLLSLQKKDWLNSKINSAYDLSDAKKFKEAAAAFEEARKVNPSYPGLLFARARAYYDSGDYNAAAEAFELEVIRKTNFDAVIGHFSSLQKLGRSADISASADRFLPLFTDNASRLEMNKRKIAVLINNNRMDAAQQALEPLLTAQPNEPTWNILSGNLSFKQGEYYRAEEAYLKATKNLAKEDFVVSYNLGVVACKKGEYDRALPLMTKAAGLLDKNSGFAERELVSFYSAIALFKLGRQREAEQQIRAAIVYGKQNKAASEADNLRLQWRFCEIFSKDTKNLLDKVLSAEISDYIEKCIANKLNREIAFFASNLKVLLTPGAKVTLTYPSAEMAKPSPVFAGEFFIYLTKDMNLKAISEQTSLTVWETAQNSPLSAPLFADRLLYAAFESEFIKAIDIATGKEAWRIKDYAKIFSVLDGGDIVYANTSLVRAGEKGQLWKTELPISNISRIEVSANRVIVASSKAASVFDLNTGALIRTIALVNPAAVVPLEGEVAAITGSGDKTVLEIWNTLSGEKTVVFQLKRSWNNETRILRRYKKIFLAEKDGNITAMDLDTSKRIWNISLKEEIADALLTGEDLIVTTAGGKCMKLDGTKGSIVWETQAKAGSDGMVTLLIGKP